jgi:hypothetical protein
MESAERKRLVVGAVVAGALSVALSAWAAPEGTLA